MTEAAGQIIGQLQTLGQKDREWILGRLSRDERLQVLAALSGNGAEPAGDAIVATATGRRGNGESLNASTAKTSSEFADLDRATPKEIASLLGGEADWTVVVLLGGRDWSWTEQFLSSLPPARLRALRELSNALGETVRPRVRDAVVNILADRMRARTEGNPHRSIFDMLLERAEYKVRDDGVGNGDST